MKIWVHIHTRTTYGGHSSFSLVGQYFESGQPDFGSAIREIDVNPYFVTPAEIVGSAESITDLYGRFIAGLPSRRYSRKKGKLELNYLSRLGDSRLVESFGPPKLDVFVAAAKEAAEHLLNAGACLKRSDDFDFAAFTEWIRQRLDSLPKDTEELAALAERLAEEAKRARDAMDEWDKLGVDWEDYHPNARQILDNPFFWKCADDFAPHGNDTGADVLSLYSEWRGKSKRTPAAKFLDQLVRDWGMTTAYPSGDETMDIMWEEAKIGFAFAQLKIDGVCDESVRSAALDAISRCRTRTIEKHRDWELFDERIRMLDQLESKLRHAVSS